MSQVRFISDLHLDHKTIAQLRGFHDEFYHNEYIINQWNSIVNKRDLTYILGDITKGSKNYEILDRLLGRKIAVLGNHENRKHVSELLKYVDYVAGMIKYSSKQYGNFWLTHCPVYPMELDPKFRQRIKGNIHGHIHNGYKIDDPRYINVCAEVINYNPITLQQISEIFKKQHDRK